MDVLRKADDGLSNGIMFSSTVEVAMQQVVLCLSWCALMGQPKSTTSNARAEEVTSSTGKRSAGKLARCVWTGGKSVSSYLSVLIGQNLISVPCVLNKPERTNLTPVSSY